MVCFLTDGLIEYNLNANCGGYGLSNEPMENVKYVSKISYKILPFLLFLHKRAESDLIYLPPWPVKY